jgi:hypothetical protein
LYALGKAEELRRSGSDEGKTLAGGESETNTRGRREEVTQMMLTDVLVTRERDRMIKETLQQMESQIEKMLRSGATVECGLPTAVLENGKVVINAFHGAILFRCDPKWTTTGWAAGTLKILPSQSHLGSKTPLGWIVLGSMISKRN